MLKLTDTSGPLDDFLPREILVELQSHYFTAVAEAEAAYDASRDERGQIVAFGRHLMRVGQDTDFTTIHLEIGNRANPPCGIFQLEVRDSLGKVVRRHGLLFHARHHWKDRDAQLLDAARSLGPNFRRGIVIDYSPAGFSAACAAHVVAANADRKRLRQRMRKLSDMIGIDFVHGRMGLSGLYWDPDTASLYDPETGRSNVVINHVFLTRVQKATLRG